MSQWPRGMLPGRWLVAALAVLAFSRWRCAAEIPSVEGIYPAGFARCSTNQMTVAGKLEPWPPRVWTDCPGVAVTALTNKGSFQVVIGDAARPGPHLLRFFNEHGASDPRILVVSAGRELLEQEPNDHFAKAQPIVALPVTVNGRLDKAGDVDSFGVRMAAGQWLEARLDCYTLASKVDALLRLVTPDGVQQAWNHDFTSLDPRLCWQAPAAGLYVVQVMGFKFPADSEVRLTGGTGCVYRLRLEILDRCPELITDGAPEQEPNNSACQARLWALPASIHGAIASAEDEDCFGFSVKKDEIVDISLEAASVGSPLDPWIKLIDLNGKELVRMEPPGRFQDPQLEWKAPAPGTNYVVVGNTLHRGGAGFGYRLSVRPAKPDIRIVVGMGALVLTGGETNVVKLIVRRSAGFNHKLTAAFQGLPEGVHAQSVEITGQGAEVALQLVADPDAKPAQRPVQIICQDGSTGEERPALFMLTSSSEDNGVPGGYAKLLVESTDQIWLTIKPAKPAK